MAHDLLRRRRAHPGVRETLRERLGARLRDDDVARSARIAAAQQVVEEEEPDPDQLGNAAGVRAESFESQRCVRRWATSRPAPGWSSNVFKQGQDVRTAS